MTPVVAEKKADIQMLCERFGVERLELFGSATSDRFDPSRSDVDFLVRFRPRPIEGCADDYFGMLFSLEDLFLRHVDLVEEKAVENPYFFQAVEPSREMIYATVAHEKVWDILENKLPTLIVEVEAELASVKPAS